MKVAVPYTWHVSRISYTCQTSVGTKPLTSGGGEGRGSAARPSKGACSVL